MQIRTDKISVTSDYKVCGTAIALWLSVIKRGCNRSANKIQ
jgi:hypothetical protein